MVGAKFTRLLPFFVMNMENGGFVLIVISRYHLNFA